MIYQSHYINIDIIINIIVLIFLKKENKMTNKNQEAFEQMNRLTKAAKNFYGDNYNPGTLYPPRDTKFLLDLE